jgi:hypothetical protein
MAAQKRRILIQAGPTIVRASKIVGLERTARFGAQGVLVDEEKLIPFVAERDYTIDLDDTDLHQGYCAVVPTAITTCKLFHEGVAVLQFDFAIGANFATMTNLTGSPSLVVSDGDVMYVEAPLVADTTAADFAFNIVLVEAN